MIRIAGLVLPLWLLAACAGRVEKVRPTSGSITESIYASGLLKSKDQYQAYSTVSGTVNRVFVAEGDTVKAGTPICSVSSDIQKLNEANAQLDAAYADMAANRDKLAEAKLLMDFAQEKMRHDSAMYFRQQALWNQQIGSKVELEQMELAYRGAQNTYYSAVVKYHDMERDLQLKSSRSKNNLQIAKSVADEYVVRSGIDGIVYSMNKTRGDLVGPQTALCVIGDASQFILEMQVDEYDIFRINKDMPVVVVLDSYRGKTFDARVTKINPLMNERSRTFTVEAVFVDPPAVLYPNISFEANIIVSHKDNALLIPRSCILGDSLVVKASGDTVVIKTGLMDYRKAEIISGISAADELIEPKR